MQMHDPGRLHDGLLGTVLVLSLQHLVIRSAEAVILTIW
jgi:hypothetical protein